MVLSNYESSMGVKPYNLSSTYLLCFNFPTVCDILEEVQNSLKILLSESNKQQQDLNNIKDDISILKLGLSLLQHADSQNKKQLKLIQIFLFKLGDDVSDIEEDIDDLESNVEDTAECLADFKEDTTNTLTNLETTVDAIEHPCGGSDDWVKVVDFDMTVDGTMCPDDWVQSMFSLPACGRPSTPTTKNQCFAANFPFLTGTMMTFSKVCGRIKAYAYGLPDAFEGFTVEGQTQITDAYVSGISLTAGSGFSEHLWTFAAGSAELEVPSGDPTQERIDQCPCDRSNPSDIPVPDFVSNNYFCEAGINVFLSYTSIMSDDPLWDGLNCNPESSCCDFNRPPYFVNDLGKTLTVDSVDARLCFVERPPPSEGALGDDVLIERMEIYVNVPVEEE